MRINAAASSAVIVSLPHYSISAYRPLAPVAGARDRSSTATPPGTFFFITNLRLEFQFWASTRPVCAATRRYANVSVDRGWSRNCWIQVDPMTFDAYARRQAQV